MNLCYRRGRVCITHRVGDKWRQTNLIEPLVSLLTREFRKFFAGFTGAHWHNLGALYLRMVRISEWHRVKVIDNSFRIHRDSEKSSFCVSSGEKQLRDDLDRFHKARMAEGIQ